MIWYISIVISIKYNIFITLKKEKTSIFGENVKHFFK